MFAVKLSDTLHTSVKLCKIIRSQGPDFFLPRSVDKHWTTNLNYWQLIILYMEHSGTAIDGALEVYTPGWSIWVE